MVHACASCALVEVVDVLRNDFDLEPLLQRGDGFAQPSGGQGGGAPAEIQAGGPLFPRMLPAHQMDFPDQSVQVAVHPLRAVDLLAIGAEAAQRPAEGNVDIQAQVRAVLIGKELVVFLSEGEGFDGPGQPHPGQISDDTHGAPRPKCI